MVTINPTKNGELCIKAYLQDDNSKVQVHMHNTKQTGVNQPENDIIYVRQIRVYDTTGPVVFIDHFRESPEDCDVW